MRSEASIELERMRTDDSRRGGASASSKVSSGRFKEATCHDSSTGPDAVALCFHPKIT